MDTGHSLGDGEGNDTAAKRRRRTRTVEESFSQHVEIERLDYRRKLGTVFELNSK